MSDYQAVLKRRKPGKDRVVCRSKRLSVVSQRRKAKRRYSRYGQLLTSTDIARWRNGRSPKASNVLTTEEPECSSRVSFRKSRITSLFLGMYGVTLTLFWLKTGSLVTGFWMGIIAASAKTFIANLNDRLWTRIETSASRVTGSAIGHDSTGSMRRVHHD